MPTSQIQAAVDAIATAAGPQPVRDRSATRCCSSPAPTASGADPLNFQVGYYTAVAGLGQSPNDVVINGSVYVRNQCDGGSCTALNNFWRSLSNLTINVTTPGLRLLHRRVLGRVAGRPDAPRPRQRPDHADGLLHRPVVRERRLHRRLGVRRQHRDQRLAAAVAGQQQRARRLDATASGTRSSRASSARRPSASPPAQRAAARTRRWRRARSPARRRTCTSTPPGSYSVFVPAVAARLRGHDVGQRPDAPARRSPSTTSSSPSPRTTSQAINNALAKGQNLIFTPGVYQLDQTIKVKRAGHRRARPRLPDARADRTATRR